MVKKLNKNNRSNHIINAGISAISVCVPSEQIVNEKDENSPDLLKFIGVKKKIF